MLPDNASLTGVAQSFYIGRLNNEKKTPHITVVFAFQHEGAEQTAEWKGWLNSTANQERTIKALAHMGWRGGLLEDLKVEQIQQPVRCKIQHRQLDRGGRIAEVNWVNPLSQKKQQPTVEQDDLRSLSSELANLTDPNAIADLVGEVAPQAPAAAPAPANVNLDDAPF